MSRKLRDELVTYIRERTCQEWRDGERCVDRHGRGDLIDGMHPGCIRAEELIEMISAES